MTQLSYLTPTAVPVSDRRTRILVMGIILLLAGALCVLILGFMSYFLLLFRRRTMSGPSFPIKYLVMPLLLYAVAGATLLWMGMGAILRRRWARPVVLAIAWPWLMVGTVGVVIAIIAIVHMRAILAGSSQTAAYSPFMFMGVFLASGVYFFFPLSLILVFQSQEVQATLEFYDPRPRWTDDKPVPVLCLCVYLLLTAVTFAMNSRGVFPFFGGLITGAQGVVAVCLIVVTLLLAMVRSLRLHIEGWLLSLAMLILLPASTLVTLLRINPMEMYRAMGLSDDDLFMAERMGYAQSGSMIAWIVVGAGIGIGFAIVARRSFFAPAGFNAVMPPSPAEAPPMPQSIPPENS